MKSILTIFIAGMILMSLAAVSIHAEDSNVSENKSRSIVNENEGIGTALSSEIHAKQDLHKEGNYTISLGKFLNVKVMSADLREIRIGNATVETDMNLSIEDDEDNNTHMNAHLNNGNNLEIKTMPDAASAKALTRLGLKVCNESNNCTITLKETGINNEDKAQYELKADRNVKVLGLFNAKMHVEARIGAATGEIIQSKVPWWSAISTKE